MDIWAIKGDCKDRADTDSAERVDILFVWKK